MHIIIKMALKTLKVHSDMIVMITCLIFVTFPLFHTVKCETYIYSLILTTTYEVKLLISDFQHQGTEAQ